MNTKEAILARLAHSGMPERWRRRAAAWRSGRKVFRPESCCGRSDWRAGGWCRPWRRFPRRSMRMPWKMRANWTGSTRPWSAECWAWPRTAPYGCRSGRGTRRSTSPWSRDAVVATMQDAVEDPRFDRDFGFGCFMSGPSKTADIEQALVIGAHGPMSVTVVLTGGKEAAR